MKGLLENDMLDDEERYMGSVNHSSAQTQITGLLFNDERFTTFIELSLDASQIDLSQFEIKSKNELIPDISVYEDTPLAPDPLDDILRVSQIPNLAIEVLSPKQMISEILGKFKAYFALGVKSCWLVVPALKTVTVYSKDHFKTFDVNDTEFFDEVMDIRLPIQQIFRIGK
jgi:Uma2 family endonuclease